MSKISLIIRREFNERVRKKSFLVTTILTPLLFVGLIGGMIAMMSLRSGEVKNIEVIDGSGIVAGGLESSGLLKFRPTDRTLEEINASHPDTWGVLVIGEDIVTDPNDVQLYTYSTSTFETETAIAGAIADIVEAEKLKSYDIENLPQILEEVRTGVNLKAYKVDDSGAEKESSSVLSMALAYILGFLMYIFVLLYGAQVMNGVIEEKNSKVLEVMVSSVRPFQLMMGKIIGIALVAITQFVIWVAVIAIFSTAMIRFVVPADLVVAAQGMTEVSGGVAGTPAADMAAQNFGTMGSAMGGSMGGAMTPGMTQAMEAFAENPEAVSALGNLMDVGYLIKMLVAFLIYFAGGYLLYAAMFAAVGSAVDNVQDSQQFQMPVTLPLMLGFIGMINAMQDPTGSLAFWLSIIPFTSPMVMVARIAYGVPAWEIALSIGLLAATFVLMVWLAGKIYRVGIFMYGKKPTFKELAKWITYKS